MARPVRRHATRRARAGHVRAGPGLRRRSAIRTAIPGLRAICRADLARSERKAVNGWLALLAAGLLEVAWALGLKCSDGLTRFWPTAATVVAIALSFGLMAIALRSLPF